MELTYNDLKTDMDFVSREDGRFLFINLSGRINSQSWKEYYDAIFLKTLEEVETNKPDTVEINVEGVEMCNSSGIMSLFQWFKKLTANDLLQEADIIVRYSKNVEWQNNALLTLFKGFIGKIKYEAI